MGFSSWGTISVFVVDGEAVAVDAVSNIHSDIGSAHSAANGSHIGSVTCDGRRCYSVCNVVVDAFGMGFSSLSSVSVFVVDGEVVAVDAVGHVHGDIGSSHGTANGGHVGSVAGDIRRGDGVISAVCNLSHFVSMSGSASGINIVDGQGMNVRSVSDGHGDIFIRHVAAHVQLVRGVASNYRRGHIVFCSIIQGCGVVVCSESLITIYVMDSQEVTVEAEVGGVFTGFGNSEGISSVGGDSLTAFGPVDKGVTCIGGSGQCC